MSETYLQDQKAIYTVGHSNHSIDTFIHLLQHSNIQVVVDIRSKPISRVVPHFNRKSLENALKSAGIKYMYFGKELGGRPDGKEFYDTDGHVLYTLIAKTSAFNKAIDRLLRGIQQYRVALLCSEENPANCHRRLLVGRVLVSRGVRMEHISGDGRIQKEEELWEGERNGQLTLFEGKENNKWKSTQSVLPRKARNNSSEP